MYLEHVNLVVSDVPAMIHFYQTAFPHWKVRSEGDDEWHGKPRHWLHLGDDYQYLAISNHGEGQNRNLDGYQVGLAHFAYSVDNLESIVERLVNNGYEIAKPGAENPFRKNVYFVDPAGFEVEFVEYSTDIPSERNNDL